MTQPTRRSIGILVATLCALAAALPAAPAFATKPLGYTVSGSVTSLAAGHLLVIDGKTYNVPVQSGAMAQLRQLQVGETVDLVLNGPPGAASTQVLAIHVHSAP